jgi:hypothetical protein
MFEHLRRIVHRNTRLEITTRNVCVSRSTAAALIAPVIPNPFGSGANICAGTAEGEISESSFSLEDLPSTIPNNNCKQIICWLRCNRFLFF